MRLVEEVTYHGPDGDNGLIVQTSVDIYIVQIHRDTYRFATVYWRGSYYLIDLHNMHVGFKQNRTPYGLDETTQRTVHVGRHMRVPNPAVGRVTALMALSRSN